MRTAHSVSNQLARLLAERAWTDADLASRTELSRTRINRIKNGRGAPTVREALLLGAALSLPVRAIFSLESSGLRARPPEHSLS